MDISITSIGSRVRSVREERGYTREQLAEYADVSVDFLWQIETGRSSMNAQNLGKIAAALDVTTDYLVYGKTAYSENEKLNTMLSALPPEIQMHVERMITVFVDTLRDSTKSLSENDNNNSEKE